MYFKCIGRYILTNLYTPRIPTTTHKVPLCSLPPLHPIPGNYCSDFYNLRFVLSFLDYVKMESCSMESVSLSCSSWIPHCPWALLFSAGLCLYFLFAFFLSLHIHARGQNVPLPNPPQPTCPCQLANRHPPHF